MAEEPKTREKELNSRRPVRRPKMEKNPQTNQIKIDAIFKKIEVDSGENIELVNYTLGPTAHTSPHLPATSAPRIALPTKWETHRLGTFKPNQNDWKDLEENNPGRLRGQDEIQPWQTEVG